jgi:16S rRNA (adenine1518-N6/adenine1519-N6)-dimethyltransferase
VTLSRGEARDLLTAHGLRPRRQLGQNFVVDPNTLRRIVRLAGVGEGDPVLEIGAGLGALTEALLEAGARVRAVEVDPGLVEVLSRRPELAEAQIVLGDAQRADWDEIVPAAEGPWTLVANLPYNVATPVVLRILEEAPQVERMLVMVQLEVAERLAAGPGDEAYGAASVRVAYHATASVVGKVPPTVFLPQPSVDSGLVQIVRREAPAVDLDLVSEAEIFVLVKAAFGQRRKMLRRSLAGLLGPEAFAAAGVDPTLRPEELDVESFGRLAAAR